MNKLLKGAICAGLCVTMCAAAGCKNKKLDPETRQLQLAIGALDGNFNPFFYTAQNDGEMIAMTQISMLTNDEDGNLVCGDDQPTVVQSYTTTKKTVAGAVTEDDTAAATTEYEFVIKDGIKFSDGTPLTIKDVLFNFYVYLDPAYTGSATMYSTDIVGLKSYRSQTFIPEDSEDSGMESTFTGRAAVRVNNLIYWSEDGGTLSAQGTEDLATVKKLFKEEVESDWTALSTSWAESYEKTYRFTATWQAYMFQEGLIQVQTRINSNGATEQIYEDKNGNGVRDDGELYYTTLDPDQEGSEKGTVQAQHHINAIAAATTEDKVQAYMSANDCDREVAIEALQREYAVNAVITNYTSDKSIADVLRYWATGTNALTEFANDERTAYYKNIKEQNGGELVFPTISGITTSKNAAGNDVLKIVINGVDPKAIYNFSIPIAPLHYYSGTWNGKDYVAEADGSTHFGLEFSDSNFFADILQGQNDSAHPDKSGVPVGAGAYKATTNRGGDNPSRNTFLNNNICYFVRNDNFYTVAANIENAKIKYVNYKVYGDDKILTALVTKEIDFGEPNATPANNNEVMRNRDYLGSATYETGGYGYVGINPKFVPEYPVRQAIMKAMNTKETLVFYGTELAKNIYRPMSRTSWAYPKNASGETEYEDIAFTTDKSKIIELVESAGYVKEGGVYTKRRNVNGMANAKLGTKLKITFTIAGETTEHPAYQMFCNTRDWLNDIGFDITVQTDLQALKKMTSGNLAVWAAAWSSASDPDMYQVYHKDSSATSVNNWNYPQILNNSSEWRYEYNIIQNLSDEIDEARTMSKQEDRIPVYERCLNLVMSLAVELPTYQRNDLCVYNKQVIDADTLVKNANFNVGLFSRLWEINYVK